MTFDHDYIVIGSGFGGSVMTCRLVEKGYDVCLLERGRQWKMNEFPRRPQEIQQRMFWDPEDQKFGLMEFRDTPESDVITLTASGLGGGSLIYANVLYRMPEDFFKSWPAPYSRSQLDPYYDKVLDMMEASPYPYGSNPYYRNTPKTTILKRMAEEVAPPDEAATPTQFVLPPLAVRFQGSFPGHQSHNKHGALQSRCTKCGDCDIGCNIQAKNTLDLNYLFRAQNLRGAGALSLRTHAEVVRIEPLQVGYKVIYKIPEMPLQEQVLTGRNVVLSAGSVGSTTLLLRMKKEGLLPNLNIWLGKKWSGNGDLLGMIFGSPENIDATNGPVITAAIEYKTHGYPDGYPHGMYIQEAGYPVGLSWYLSGKVPQFSGTAGLGILVLRNLKNYVTKKMGLGPKSSRNIGDELAQIIDRGDFTQKAFILLGMGRDKPDGEITLDDRNHAVIKWKLNGSRFHFDRLRQQMQKIAKSLGGTYFDNPLTHLNKVISVHPLGGCPMGATAESGLVGPQGEVFGYPGLYVVDGSILPTSTGPNPSLTIAAVAELIAEQIPARSKVSREETLTV